MVKQSFDEGAENTGLAQNSLDHLKNFSMKTLIPVLLLMAAFGGRAQVSIAHVPVRIVTIQNPMTPLIILEHFARNFPDAIPYWSTEGKNYKVRYVDTETMHAHKIIYDRHGMVLRSENEVDLEQCPARLRRYYFSKYPNENIKVWLYEENSGDRRYYFKRRSKIVWFDEEGNILKKRLLFN
jgi:hypothetical protein